MESIAIGVLTGIISGVIVYFLTKTREDKYNTYFFLVDYLCRSMEDIGLEAPLDVARYASKVGDKDSLWGKAINIIIDERREQKINDEEIPEEYRALSASIILAFSELYKWADKNRLNVKRSNKFLKID